MTKQTNIHIRCPWCKCTAVRAVKQYPYIHFICKNRPACAHEWDGIYEVDIERMLLKLYK